MPHVQNPVVLCNKKVTLNILFAAVNQVLQSFAKDPQWRLEGQLGFILVLHTWSQTLMDHFHLHCLIPGGALSFTREKWKPSNEFIRRFLLHVLPEGFMKIRYFRFLSNNNKGEAIELIRRLIDPAMKWPEAEKETVIEMLFCLTGEDITLCPECKKGRMQCRN